MPRKPSPGQSLADLNPKLAAEWHPTRTGNLTPADVLPGSGYAAWWQCPEHSDHEWSAAVYSRSSGAGCPWKAGKRVDDTNSLAALKPDLANQWHPDLNGELTPSDVTHGSNRDVWWQCPTDPFHAWQATPVTRRKHGCPYCTGKATDLPQSLAAEEPKIAEQWHPTRNNGTTPQDVRPHSSKSFWWQCAEGHEWRTTVAGRHGRGCPYCTGTVSSDAYNLATEQPEIATQWHHEKNGDLTPQDVTPGTATVVWWRCPEHPALHVWPAKVYARTAGNGCPMCAGKVPSPTNDLNRYPNVAAQLDSVLNDGRSPDTVVAGSHEKLWWRCPDNPDHIWSAEVVTRTTLGAGCPRCAVRHSAPQMALADRLTECFDFDPDQHHLLAADERLRNLDLDIVVEDVKLIIEYDGWYYHRGRHRHARDRKKTESLLHAGYIVIRVRCGPLALIGPHDVRAPRHDDADAAFDAVRRKLIELDLIPPTDAGAA